MRPGVVVMLLGLVLVPLVLLVYGRRLRRRTPALQGAFWGTVTGHIISICIATVAALVDAREWERTDYLRGFGGMWSLLVLPLSGGIVGYLARRG